MMFICVKQCCVCGVVISTRDKRIGAIESSLSIYLCVSLQNEIVFFMTCNDECFKYLDECF